MSVRLMIMKFSQISLLSLLAMGTATAAREHKLLPPQLVEAPTVHACPPYRREQRLKFSNGIEALAISDPRLSESVCICAIPVGSCHDHSEGIAAAQITANIIMHGPTMASRCARKYLSKCDLAETLLGFTCAHSQCTAATIDLAKAITQPAFIRCIGQPTNAFIRMDNILQRILHPPQSTQAIDKHTAEQLMRWHKHYYKPQSIKVVLFSAQPIADLQSLLVESFGMFPSSAPTVIENIPDLIAAECRGKIIAVCDLEAQPTIRLLWEASKDLSSDRIHKPVTLLANALDLQVKNPIYSCLMDKGYVLAIDTREQAVASDKVLLTTTVTLTQKGLQEWQFVLRQMLSSFHSLQSLKIGKGCFKQIKSYLEEQRHLYAYFEPLEEAIYIAQGLLREQIENYSDTRCAPKSFSASRLRELIDELHATRALAVISTPSNGAAHGFETFCVQDFIQSQATTSDRKWRISIPMIPEPTACSYPVAQIWEDARQHVIRSDWRGRFTWIEDCFFCTQQAGMTLRLYPEALSQAMDDQAMAILVSALVHQRLKETVKLAQALHVELDIHTCQSGWQLEVFGNEALVVQAMLEILRALRYLTWSTDEFERVKGELLTSQHSAIAPLCEQIDAIDERDLYQWYSKLWKQCYYECLLYGLAERQAQAVSMLLEGVLNSEPYAYCAPQVTETGAHGHIEEITANGIDGILLTIPMLRCSPKQCALQHLYARWINEMFFQKLVYGGTAAIFIDSDCLYNSRLGYTIKSTMVSASRSSANLALAVRSLIASAGELFQPEQFERLRRDLLEQFKGAPSSMKAYFKELTRQIDHPNHAIKRADIVEALEDMSYHEALEKLSVHLRIE